MNGYDVDVLEMHRAPGGCCTSWKRKGYVFDYCIHNLSGTKPGSDLRMVWDELGALRDTRIIDHDRFVTVQDPSDRMLKWYTDPDRLARHMKELAPGDAKAIDELVKNIRKFISADPFASSMGGFMRTLKILPRVGLINWFSEMKLAVPRQNAIRHEIPRGSRT